MLNNKKSFALTALLAIGGASSLIGCSQSYKVAVSGGPNQSAGDGTPTSTSTSPGVDIKNVEPLPQPSISPSPAPSSSPLPVVCDPLEGNPTKQAKSYGISGKIFYLDASQTRYTSSEDYAQFGHELPADLFMSKIDVIPRKFREGFLPSDGGAALAMANGDPLIEYFGLQLDTQIVLGAGDEPGLYQFGIMSDDGSTVSVIDAKGESENLISWEGAHATGLGCAKHAIELDADSKLQMHISYFQGPRYQLSLMLMWRKVSDAHALSENFCGQFRVNEFFNPNTRPSTPLKPYRELLADGWKVLDASNFLLPDAKEDRCGKMVSVPGHIASSGGPAKIVKRGDVILE